MTEFRVWAPFPGRVDLVLSSETVPMSRAEGGWWSVSVPAAGAGTRYGFSLDGGPRRPDPRSPYQPSGIDGPSEVVDHGAFEWTDQGWRGVPLASAVVYEVHVGTFTPSATFDGIIEHLDHLVSLGVTAVELMPVAEFSGDRGWGYDGVLPYAPHRAYGGPSSLKRLIDAAHGRGLAVVMDVVYNHLGPAGNYLAEFGPYFTDRYSTPWGQAVNFDGADSDEVRRFFIDNALMWLGDYHIDGLRLDAVHAIVDTSAVHVLEQLANEVAALSAHLGRSLWLIAESDLNDPRVVRRPEVGGYGIDAQWSDDFHHALHAVLTGERAGYYEDFGSLADVARALTRAYVVDGRYSKHRRRRHGRPIESLSGHHFLGYVQNHDQIGNRALGERLSQLVGPGRLRVAAALVLMAPFVPMLFQGEEWGASTPFQYFTDHRDPALARAVSEGRQGEFAAFGWSPGDVPDPQDPATWQRSVLRWDEVGEGPHASLLAWHRYLIRLRASVPALTDGRLDQVQVAFEELDPVRWLTVRRGPVVVAVNLGPERHSVPLWESGGLSGAGGAGAGAAGLAVAPASEGDWSRSAGRASAGLAVALASEEDVAVDPSGAAISLPPDTVAILLAE